MSDATLFALATYDSSGQTVHPDIAHGHGAASGFWLAITPYPGGDASHENPSIFRSSDTEIWSVPAGVTNPLALPNAFTGYQSDPDILFNPTDQRLWMYYRSLYSTTTNTIKRDPQQRNGSSWDAPTVVLTTPAHQVVSPSIVRNGPVAPWEDVGGERRGRRDAPRHPLPVERRTSTDGLNWSRCGHYRSGAARPGVIWHIDVEWVPGRAEYWAVYNTFVSGENCATHALYLARSTDGVHWITSPSPIARSGLVDAFADVIYRSSFLPDPAREPASSW